MIPDDTPSAKSADFIGQNNTIGYSLVMDNSGMVQVQILSPRPRRSKVRFAPFCFIAKLHPLPSSSFSPQSFRLYEGPITCSNIILFGKEIERI
jgi:hypothetical protein